MSGHSKWSTIKRQKQATDIKRGQSFTKVANAITIAAREGGGDPNTNIKLQFAIEKAKAVNTPKENIQRAIDKGTGKSKEGEILEQMMYEGYGPAGIAVMVEVTTDNRQRTAAEMKNIFERSGGTMAGQGSVSYMFKKMGLIRISTDNRSEDDMMLAALNSGAEDVEYAKPETEIYTKPEDLMKVKESLEKSGFKVIEAELTEKPTTVIPVTDSNKAKQILNLLDALEENESVQKVYANFDIPDNLLQNQ